MKSFLQKHSAKITGVLTGFDRLVLRGTLRQLAYVKGMQLYLNVRGVLLKDFGKHSEEVTKQIRAASEGVAQDRNRPILYMPSAGVSKEDVAREIAERDGVERGLICMLKAVEPCWSYKIRGDRKAKQIRLVPQERKCLHLYQYWVHPVFGFMHARIQTWFPFNVQICLNGREWLARSMDQAGLRYRRVGNCFPEIEHVDQAQALMDQQLPVQWPRALQPMLDLLNPVHSVVLAPFRADYYWSVYQSEVATDVMFRDPPALERLYPSLVLHGITALQSPDVLRYLGHHRRTTEEGRGIRKNFSGDVTSSHKRRSEGVRVKHFVNGNSVKIYDKAKSVLRVETTINNPKDFTVYRPKEGDSDGPKKWRPLRRGIADLARRAEISRASNNRYLDALAVIDDTTPLKQLVDPVTRPTLDGKVRFRALRPWSTDAEFLEAVNRGEFKISGFRNRDIRRLLFPPPQSDADRKKQMGVVSRRLRLLRAHGLLMKVHKTHRYLLTKKGRTTVAAVLAARTATIEGLTRAA